MAEWFEVQTLQDYSLPECRGIPLPCLLACFSRQIFFATPLENFPKPLIFFTICAGKVYYKLANIYYKLCNARYKVYNKRYKLCNKNFLK